MLDFHKNKAPLVVIVPVDRLHAKSWGPGPGLPSFCLPLAQELCDGQRLQLITRQRPGLTPSVCLRSKTFAIWVPAFCKLVCVSMVGVCVRGCECARIQTSAPFAASPHEL